MAKHFISKTAAFLCGTALLLGCSSDTTPGIGESTEPEGPRIAYLGLEGQQQLLSSSSNKVLELMDNSKTQAFIKYLNDNNTYQLDVVKLITSITTCTKPYIGYLIGQYAKLAQSLENGPIKGSALNFSIDFDLEPKGMSSMITSVSSGKNKHTANLKLGGKTTSVIYSISDQAVKINDDLQLPKKIDWELQHQGNFLISINGIINKFDLESAGTMIDIQINGQMDNVKNLITLKLERKTGLHAGFTTTNGSQTLLGFKFDINTDLTGVNEFDWYSLVTWLINTEHKTIEFSTTLMDGEVTSCARTVDPFNSDEKALLCGVVDDIKKDSIINAERLSIIFDHMIPYTTQNIYFQGIENSQASVGMLTRAQIESIDYDKLMTDARQLDNFINTIKNSELTELPGALGSVITLINALSEDISMIDEILYDLPVVIHAENVKDDNTINITKYWENSGIDAVKDRYKSMTFSVIEPFINRETPLIANQDDLTKIIEFLGTLLK